MNQHIDDFVASAVALQTTLLRILDVCKEFPEEAPQALKTIDIAIASMIANQASLPSYKELLTQPAINSAKQVREEILVICRTFN